MNLNWIKRIWLGWNLALQITTHAAFGYSQGFMITLFFTPFPFKNLWLPISMMCAFFAVCPDFDLFFGKPFTSHMDRHWGIEHRSGLTHSIYSFLFPLIFLPLNPFLVFLISLSLFSHWFLDALTIHGVRTANVSNLKNFFSKWHNDFQLTSINTRKFIPNMVVILVCFYVPYITVFILFALFVPGNSIGFLTFILILLILYATLATFVFSGISISIELIIKLYHKIRDKKNMNEVKTNKMMQPIQKLKQNV